MYAAHTYTSSQPGSIKVKLEGSLDTFPLRELVEMVVYSSVTGVLNIYGPSEQGRIYVRDGVVYHVEHGRSHGVEALAELLELSSATFAFVSNMQVEAETLSGSLGHNLQGAERIAARWKLIRAYVPHLDLIPTLLLAREAALRRVGPAHHPVLAAIDGQASLRQIAAGISWAEIDVAEAVVQMTVDGLVDLRNQHPGAASGIPSDSAHSSGGLFDRLRARGPAAQRLGGEAEPARAAESRSSSEELILKLLRS